MLVFWSQSAEIFRVPKYSTAEWVAVVNWKLSFVRPEVTFKKKQFSKVEFSKSWLFKNWVFQKIDYSKVEFLKNWLFKNWVFQKIDYSKIEFLKNWLFKNWVFQKVDYSKLPERLHNPTKFVEILKISVKTPQNRFSIKTLSKKVSLKFSTMESEKKSLPRNLSNSELLLSRVYRKAGQLVLLFPTPVT